MDTSSRMFFAFLGAAAAFAAFVWVCTWRRRRQRPPRLSEREHLDQVLRQVASGWNAAIADGGFRFVRHGLEGRLDFIADTTEIQVRTRDLVGQVVEVVPIGFPMSLFSSGGTERLRARGSKTEYDRIFKRPADEQVLLEVGVAYDLRLSPDGMVMRFHSLPGSAAALSYWISCAFRIVDLIPGADSRAGVDVTEVTTQVRGDTPCQVCGAPLTDDRIVRCARCSTPHHEQCWDYTRKCSTFGCPGTRCVA